MPRRTGSQKYGLMISDVAWDGKNIRLVQDLLISRREPLRIIRPGRYPQGPDFGNWQE